MAIPVLTPKQTTNPSILGVTGTIANVIPALPYGIYNGSSASLSGAVDQVAFVYKMLGGDVLDVEVSEGMVYTAYELAVLEYSYLINLHQAQNSLNSFLGSTTGTFNQDGFIITGSLSGTNVSLKYPRFSLAYARSISDEIAYESGIGGIIPFYSASINITASVQDYDLQAVVITASYTDPILAAAVTASAGAQIRVNKVYFKSPNQAWRFFGGWGGLSTVGNFNSFGQFAQGSTFDIIPAWQTKLQMMNYEVNLYTRTSHYSYEIRNNKIRLFPVPSQWVYSGGPQKIWFIFSFADSNPDLEALNLHLGFGGVNNLNTLPFENLPYDSINSIGKQWIRSYALAIVKGMLGQVRGKFEVLPIPGDAVTLNHASLLSQSTDEMERLREELKGTLAELTYQKVMEMEANIIENVGKIHSYIPKLIYVG